MSGPRSIAAAQVASRVGEVEANAGRHVECVERAAALGVGVVVFPELSLTGYDPRVAAGLAMELDDVRLDALEGVAQAKGVWVVAGAPLRGAGGRPGLGAIVLAPGRPRRQYWKMHLGGEEPAHFDPGQEPFAFEACGERIGLSICADAGRESHPRCYAEQGATVYAAGVFLNREWEVADRPRLARWAMRYGMVVVMANHGASNGRLESSGRSAAWDEAGEVLAEAKGVEDCLVVAERDSGRWRGRVEGI